MRKTIRDIQKMKDRGERIPMVTAYDYTSAQIVDRSGGIPLILVGDTLGMVVLGYPNTVPVTMEDMLHHTQAVVRGSHEALIVADMPFLTYASRHDALRNGGRLLQEGGAQVVKLEGGRSVTPMIRALVGQGIPVMGHLGLTPQSVNQIGGMRVQGKRAEQARRLIEDALKLQEAGVFAIVLELVPTELAGEITRRLRIPTIGIGAGNECAGQVLVWHDLLGLYADHLPRHARRYANLSDTITTALQRYTDDVREGSFPGAEHSSRMNEEELREAVRPTESGLSV
ncbi:MAG: 3-methyl-2-oxobutanoate hydroxymethyltransferase [Chloroflexota bacterium]|nr:MAG: 3-methyl-2-oxobutanoate hydroxymethyltransferase [Chloroflexota bacterium]